MTKAILEFGCDRQTMFKRKLIEQKEPDMRTSRLFMLHISFIWSPGTFKTDLKLHFTVIRTQNAQVMCYRARINMTILIITKKEEEQEKQHTHHNLQIKVVNK